MNKVINLLVGELKSSEVSESDVNRVLVCNYTDNYYGDQVCVPAEVSGEVNQKR